MSIILGTRFNSFNDLRESVEKYKLSDLNEYFIRDCRTIAYQRKRALSTVEHLKYSKAEDLRYYYIRYSCIHGGRPYQIKKSARQTKTFKKGCKAGFFLKLCGDALEVKELTEEHCHETSAAIFRTLYHQRLKLPEDLKKDVKSCLAKGGNKKQIRNDIIKKTACHITLKDLTNLNRKKLKVKNVQECLQMLENDYNCEIELLYQENKSLQAFYFQDKQMKDRFQAFPEILFMGGTTCLVDKKAFCYILIIEDPNGNNEVVAGCFIFEENLENVNWFIETFKSHNKEWKRTKIILTDRDLQERNVLKKTFPDTDLIISFSLVNQIFNRDIHKKLGITSQEITVSETFLQRLAHSESPQQYEEIYSQFKLKVPDCVVHYYNKNWHPIRSQWVMGFSCYKAENRLEQVNSKLKSELTRFSDMEKCLQNLFKVINLMRLEIDTKTTEISHKIRKSSTKLINTTVYEEYENLLTPFAYTLVEEALNKAYKEDSFTSLGANTFLFKNSDLLLEVTPRICECLFFMGLPCGHIFECRRILNLSVFDETLCSERWKTSYYLLHQRVHSLPDENISDRDISTSSEILKLSQQQKCVMMRNKCLKLSQLGADVDGRTFKHRYEIINSIIDAWNQGEEILVSRKKNLKDTTVQKNIELESTTNEDHGDHNYSQIRVNNSVSENNTSDNEYYQMDGNLEEEVTDVSSDILSDEEMDSMSSDEYSETSDWSEVITPAKRRKEELLSV